VKGVLALVVVVMLAQSATAARPRSPYALSQPAGIVVLADGSLLVAERGLQDRILRVYPAGGAFTVFARGVPDPFAIARARDGSYFVSSDSGLYRVPRRGGRARPVVPIPMSPLVVGTNGDLYFAHGSEVGRLPAGSTKPAALDLVVNFPHGIALDGRGGLVVSDTGNGRVVRIDLASRQQTELASNLRDPMGLVLEPGGTVVAIEFRSGRLLRIAAGMPPAPVARELRAPYALARARTGRFYVVETGDVARATGRLARVDPDGTVTRLRLHPA
jgi:NHL repeat